MRLDRKIHTQPTEYQFKQKKRAAHNRRKQAKNPLAEESPGKLLSFELFEEHRFQLNLQPSENGLLECRGRI